MRKIEPSDSLLSNKKNKEKRNQGNFIGEVSISPTSSVAALNILMLENDYFFLIFL